LPLLFLEDPSKLTEFSAYDLCSDDSAPSFFLCSLAVRNDDYTRQLIALHPNTPQDTRAALLQSLKPSVQLAAAQGMMAFHQLDWSALSQCSSLDVCQLVAEYPECPSDVLMNLAVHHSAQVRALVAANSNTKEAVLEILALDPEACVRQAVAENIATPKLCIERLRNDTAPEVARVAKAFPDNLQGLRGSRKELGHSQFSTTNILEELRQTLVTSSQYETNYCCMGHYPFWRDDELENGDNSLDPRDIASNQLHRKRGPKPDSWSRTKNSWPCAIRRGKVSFHFFFFR
jgi:hypothetical protein